MVDSDCAWWCFVWRFSELTHVFSGRRGLEFCGKPVVGWVAQGALRQGPWDTTWVRVSLVSIVLFSARLLMLFAPLVQGTVQPALSDGLTRGN